MNKFNVNNLKWINKPNNYMIEENKIIIKANCKTDFWQRTHYGFQNDNAHALVIEVEGDFTFTTKTKFKSSERYDQCGVVLYEDSDNWFKASIEFEDTKKSRLGSVVTNLGYSDWATTDISTSIDAMWYRLSRRGHDYLIENSIDGVKYNQMRIFHMHKEVQTAKIGLYACSPLESSIEAVFTEFGLKENIWQID